MTAQIKRNRFNKLRVESENAGIEDQKKVSTCLIIFAVLVENRRWYVNDSKRNKGLLMFF